MSTGDECWKRSRDEMHRTFQEDEISSLCWLLRSLSERHFTMQKLVGLCLT